MLVFVFGSTTFATATVLAVFMGGLALGSFLAGRLADRINRPFLWYGILEGIIGVWALVAPFLFDGAAPLYRVIWQNFHLAVLPFGIIRFCIALLILIVPTTCMGATLPLLAKYVTSSLDIVGQRIGTLYAANTLGAVGGAAVAGLYFLPVAGLDATTKIAALINLALIVIVVAMARVIEKPSPTIATPTPPVDSHPPNATEPIEGGTLEIATPGAATPESAPPGAPPPATANHPSATSSAAGSKLTPQAKATMIAFAVSGAVAMVYEVGWTRTLLMVIGSSTYAFTLMLTSFLLGIFLGSLVCARLIDKAKEPLAWLAIIQFLVGAASIFCMDRFNYIPYWNLQLNAALPADPNTALAARFFIAASIMMPLTFFLGAVFPAAVKTCVNDLSAVGRSVGTLYSANTLGAIIGAFLAGFVLVPLLGVERSLIAGTVVNIAVGVGLLFMVRSVRTPLKACILMITCGGALYMFMRPEVWDRTITVYAQTARRRLTQMKLFNSVEAWRDWIYRHAKLAFYEDGASSTVGVLEATSNGKTRHSLVTNGHVDASDDVDMSTQVLLAAGPIAANPGAKQIAVIGWGSGVTIGAATRLTKGTITAIELEPAVINTSKFFHHVNGAPENDPNVKVEVNDGRNFLLATDQKFDVIISEPSNPWQAGVCNLFTEEYFKLCKDRLNPGGVFGLWCQIAEVPPTNIRGILAALHKVFPYCAVLRMDDGNIVGLASQTPIHIDVDQLRENMKNKSIMEDFKRANISSPENLLARFCLGPEAIESFVGTVPGNNDDTNRLEYDVGRIYENSVSMANNNEMFNVNSGGFLSLLKQKDQSPEALSKTMCAIAKEAQLIGTREIADKWAGEALKAHPTAEVYRLCGINAFQLGNPAKAYQLWNKALELDPKNIDTLQTIGLTYLETDRSKAREEFTRAVSVDPENKVALWRIAQTYGPRIVSGVFVDKKISETENPAMVMKYLAKPLADEAFVRSHPGVLFLDAWAKYKSGKIQEAVEPATRFLSIDHYAPCGAQILGNIYFDLDRKVEAWSCWRRVVDAGPNLTAALLDHAKDEMKANRKEQALEDLETALTINPLNEQSLKLLGEWASKDHAAATMSSNIEKIKSMLPH